MTLIVEHLKLLHRITHRMGNDRLEFAGHRELQVQAFRWNRLFEPASVDGVYLAGAIKLGKRRVRQREKLRIIPAHHAAVDLTRLLFSDHHPFKRVLGLGALALEQRIIHVERRCLTRL